MTDRRLRRLARTRRGFTLIEVLVALALLLGGIVAIVQLFPVSLNANLDAELKGNAAVLAQLKVQEFVRDYDEQLEIYQAPGGILAMGAQDPNNLETWTWEVDPRLTYSYASESATGEGPSGVGYVIVRLAPSLDPDQRVIYELPFEL